MKFSQFPYQRLDLDQTLAQMEQITQTLQAASSAQEQIDAMLQMDRLMTQVSTTFNIAEVRHTIDTRDPFYDQEQTYNDSIRPLISEKQLAYNKILAASPFRKELEERFGPVLFDQIDLFLRSFSPELTPLIQEENRLESEYQKLSASAAIPFDGKICNLSQLGPYMQSPDRATRHAAHQAYGAFFDEHQAEFDDIYDQMVKNRTQQAKLMGFDNYVEMAFLLRGRLGYTAKDVANFRRQVVEELVPITVEIKKAQAKRVGIDWEDFKVYDDSYSFPDGNPTPQGTPEELMAAGKKMYHELSPETAGFIDLMFENDLFDVLAKEGKANGGYCTEFPAYHCPFIFANWNGTAGDVDVLTHEAGHAFAAYMADRCLGDTLLDLHCPTMEGAESHSMSMEFLTAPWHHLFFGSQTDKYALYHAESALTFIPYGCQVDHFQESVYLHPEWTPAQRNEEWNRLEKLYRPYMDNSPVNFYARGARWQRQLHIYECPFYYIDYSLAQTISLQFWALSLEDHAAAWEKYLSFVKLGGTRSFVELVRSAGLLSPLEDGSLAPVVRRVKEWLDTHQLA